MVLNLQEGNRLKRLTNRQLRNIVVKAALEWERRFSVLPPITGAIAEYDAARIKGTSLNVGKGRRATDTAVRKGGDFRKGETDYQVKGNRPSGKPGSKVSLAFKRPRNYNWDRLIWVLYDKEFHLVEAWEHSRDEFRRRFGSKKLIRPDDMRKGRRLRTRPCI